MAITCFTPRAPTCCAASGPRRRRRRVTGGLCPWLRMRASAVFSNGDFAKFSRRIYPGREVYGLMFITNAGYSLAHGQMRIALSVSLRIDHHAHEQDGVSALISDYHQKRMIGDET